jgi:predicted SAM-dependent methyltransferase
MSIAIASPANGRAKVRGMGTLKQRIGALLFPRLPVSRFLFDILRDEFRASRISAKNRLIPSRRRKLAIVRRTRGQYVNAACGPHVVPGFLNLDTNETVPGVLPWDCRRALPLDEGMAAGIRAEQFVEHLEPREELPSFLASAHRALQTGGVLRIIVPDAERYLRAYCQPDLSGFKALGTGDPFPEDLPTRMDVINHIFHQWHEHRWGYDFETLEHRLRIAGFTTIVKTDYQQSLDPTLACDRDVHAKYSLYVDAQK